MNTAPSIYQIGLTDINGRETNLSEYFGKVLFVVNIASKCGFTPHYEGLQELHERYHEKGLVVCGFPSNDFFGEQSQEDEIHKFCSFNYGVTFPLFAKVHVQGKEAHPLFRLFVEHSRHGGNIKWNFSKFLIDWEGELLDRFAPFTKPTAGRVTTMIERFLGQQPKTT